MDEVIGVLTLYTDVDNAFDENVRNLLVGMAMDIDYALKNFELEAQRKRAEEALRESEQRLRTIIETGPECIMVVGERRSNHGNERYRPCHARGRLYRGGATA